MSAAAVSEPGESAAWFLVGVDLGQGWRVLERVETPPDHTGGAFSVGYLAAHSSGTMGFLKAFDYAGALADDDPARALQRLTARYNAERDLLALCGSRSLSRIVRALAAGSINVVGAPPPSVVSFLIFELADSDARSALTSRDPADQLPMIRLAHDATVAMAQLHALGAAHQDVKPSNLVVWETALGPSGKLADLGCAHMEGRPAPHDDKPIAGDCSYASPEQLYQDHTRLPDNRRRRAADMYMLGNLITYLLTGVSYNGILTMYLDRSQQWRQWQGTFDEVLPGLIDAHGLAMTRFGSALHVAIAEPVVSLVADMCYPDPERRGDSIARRRGQDPFALQRFVTRLDLIYRRASLQIV